MRASLLAACLLGAVRASSAMHLDAFLRTDARLSTFAGLLREIQAGDDGAACGVNFQACIVFGESGASISVLKLLYT